MLRLLPILLCLCLGVTADETWQAPDEAPLPEGFPAPTPPGEIRIQTYPASRAVMVEARGFFDFGLWKGFMPLFEHIDREDISMTAPIVADYPAEAERKLRGTMQMGFFYPAVDEGEAGPDGEVEVTDLAGRSYVSIGVIGYYSLRSYREAVAQLEAWLDEHGYLWEADGAPRRLLYQQPKLSNAFELYSEVQIPIKCVLAD